jgi:hypothetical protein
VLGKGTLLKVFDRFEIRTGLHGRFLRLVACVYSGKRGFAGYQLTGCVGFVCCHENYLIGFVVVVSVVVVVDAVRHLCSPHGWQDSGLCLPWGAWLYQCKEGCRQSFGFAPESLKSEFENHVTCECSVVICH